MLVWVDVETTGLEPDSLLLEVAIVVTDDALKRCAGICRVCHHPADKLEAHLNEWAANQHKASGLLTEVVEANADVEQVEEELHAWLTEELGAEPPPPMAGSTVSFDRGVLKRCMPSVEGLFHYRNIDVSSVKELGRRWFPDVVSPTKNNAHRAMGDVLESIEHLRHCRKHYFKD